MNRNLFWFAIAIPICLGCALAGFLMAPAGNGGGTQRLSAEASNPARSAQVAPQIKNSPTVWTAHRDASGQLVKLECATCHDTREPNVKNSVSHDLDLFHQGLQVQHGTLSCISCHNPGDYNSLRLANGESVAFKEKQLLCEQCHGPQTRDYRMGSHGGMRGFWNMKAPGAYRERNACVDCHDVHSPKIRQVVPLLPPLDRFLTDKPMIDHTSNTTREGKGSHE